MMMHGLANPKKKKIKVILKELPISFQILPFSS
jgi:hypothetical protein